MADSTTASRARNRSKFPLGKHSRGYWYKKVGKRFFYFEKLDADPDGKNSLRQWLDEREHILAFGERPESTTGGTTLLDICNYWLEHKETLLNAGDIRRRTFDEYKDTCKILLDILGKTLPAKSCGPKHFEKVRSKLAKRFNSNGQSKRITQIRSVFNVAYEDQQLEDQPNFGRSFKRPSARALRQLREEKGDQSFTAKQIHELLSEAGVNVRAMILLGIQAGFGNADCGELPRTAIENGWLRWARVKNAVPRRVPLWPETVKALEAAIEHANSKGEKRLCFVSPSGCLYTDENNSFRVSAHFGFVRDRAKVDKARTFYDLRRTFETVAGETADQVAVDAVMGHTPSESNMAARYRQNISDDRLQAVVNHVREWLGPIGGES